MSRGKLTVDTTGRLGDKLGPRLAQLMVSSVVGARRALAPHEAKVTQAAMQALIDRAGHEVADLYAPIVHKLLADHGDKVHPHVADFLGAAASGTHQWQALAGFAGGAASGALGQVFANALAPVVYEINRLSPNLDLDPRTAATAATAGIVSTENAIYVGASQGYNAGEMQTLMDLASNIPTDAVLAQLLNRELIGEEEALAFMHRQGYPEGVRSPILALRRSLLTPADAALAVLRGELSDRDGAKIASYSGVEAGDFAVLLANTGEPLGEEQLAEALRRGFIDEARFARGIRQSRIRDEWLDVAERLRYSPVPTADAVDAALRGHLSWADAEKIAEQNGIEPSEFAVLRDNAGSPPALEQLLELWRRGFIDESQVDEGLRFGRLRDEWIPAAKDLRYTRLSTADAADAWLRGHLDRGEAETIMRQNGLAPEDIPTALGNAGNPIAPQQLDDAARRGLIGRDRWEQGFRESRYREEWAETAWELRYSPMSTADALEALIQGHLSEAEALRIALANGLEESSFGPLRDTVGEPLSRTEAEELYNRGLMTRGQVAQALRESRLKDKYIDHALELHVRLPEPREVVTALTDGVITTDAAERMLADAGYQPDVVAMLIATGEAKATGPHRQLVTAQIQSLYSDRIIDDETATDLLGKLHYTPWAAGMLLRLADWQLQHKILQSGIAAVRSHYLAGRITDVVAASDLQALGLPRSATDTYLEVWRVDKLAHPKTLTEAQIVKATTLGLWPNPANLTGQPLADAQHQAGHDRLVSLGYDPADADLLLAGA